MKNHIKKLFNILFWGIIIIFFVTFVIPKLIYHKEILPNRTLMAIHRITGEIGIKLPNTEEIIHIQKDSVFYKDFDLGLKINREIINK